MSFGGVRPPMKMNFERWQNLMTVFGLADNRAMFNRLIELHAEPHRAYHTAEHISACLKHLDAAAHLADTPEEIEMAFWFHDAIYNPFSGTNEEDSADMAEAFLHAQNIAADICARVKQMILITKHHAITQTNDEAIMIDIDLSILGAPARIFDQYENNIRKEYRKVPSFIFKPKRRKILKEFLARPRLFQHDHFHAAWDNQARENLARAIKNI